MRRLIALLVLLVDIYFGVHHEHFGMVGPLVALLAVIVGVLASAAVIFNLRIRKPGPPQDSGFGMSEPVGFGIGAFGLLLFAVAPLLIAARGLYRGSMPALGSGPDVVLSESPIEFLLLFAMWVAIGSGVLWLFRRILISRKTADEATDTPPDA